MAFLASEPQKSTDCD